VQSYAEQTAARGAAIMTVDALNMVLISALVFLFLRQVMPIAAALAGGVALNSFGAVSRLIGWGLRSGTGATGRTATLAASQLVGSSGASTRAATSQQVAWRMS
jgi:type IV secretion system protein VirB6